MRYFAKLSYLGKNYHGWQIQPDAVSVQQIVQKSMSIVFRKDTEVVAAGRTDTGVHALEMYIHFDVELTLDSYVYCHKINALLPNDIVFYQIWSVKKDAHARFDAIQRSYEYHILSGKSPFTNDVQWQINQKLNVDAMNKAADLLLEHTNFKCFSKNKTEVKTYNCNIQKAQWVQKGNELVFHISADRFLRNMVRAIVGTLYKVGVGKIPAQEINNIINSQNRSNAGTSVPAHGLFLTKILYPETILHANK